jgi:hypothetical protein
MKVASITAEAISQGLEAGEDCRGWLEFGGAEEAAILFSRTEIGGRTSARAGF